MRKIKDWLGEWSSTLAVIAIVAVFTFQGIGQANTNQKFRDQASNATKVACAAVKESNDATYALWVKELKQVPKSERAKADSFLLDLHDAYLTAEVKCLTGGGN